MQSDWEGGAGLACTQVEMGCCQTMGRETWVCTREELECSQCTLRWKDGGGADDERRDGRTYTVQYTHVHRWAPYSLKR